MSDDMTVAELIHDLRSFPQDALVINFEGDLVREVTLDNETGHVVIETAND